LRPRRIAALYEIETRLRGDTADARRAMRQVESRALVERPAPSRALQWVNTYQHLSSFVGYRTTHIDDVYRFIQLATLIPTTDDGFDQLTDRPCALDVSETPSITASWPSIGSS
jgi:hypothetical protein